MEQEERKRAAERGDAEDGAEDSEEPAFINKFAQGVYAGANSASVADRINQQRHYVQRGTGASAENFMRR